MRGRVSSASRRTVVVADCSEVLPGHRHDGRGEHRHLLVQANLFGHQEDHRRELGAREADQQPRQAVAGDVEDRLRLLLLGRGAGHLVDVLGGLVLDDVEHVVDGDRAHQTILRVDHRNGDEVVLVDDVGDLLLVGVDRHRDDVGGHDVAEQRGRAGRDQPTQANETEQPATSSTT